MRNKNRIEPLLSLLKTQWENNAVDLRFGQLMCNFLGWVYTKYKIDPFYVEDDKMITYIAEYFEEKFNA